MMASLPLKSEAPLIGVVLDGRGGGGGGANESTEPPATEVPRGAKLILNVGVTERRGLYERGRVNDL